MAYHLEIQFIIMIFSIIIILGVTWGDLDVRTDEILSVGFRVLHIFTVFLPACISPWIYIHLNRQLRKEVYKTLHINVSPDMKAGQNVTVVHVSEK